MLLLPKFKIKNQNDWLEFWWRIIYECYQFKLLQMKSYIIFQHVLPCTEKMEISIEVYLLSEHVFKLHHLSSGWYTC